jgi:hypothetical protein
MGACVGRGAITGRETVVVGGEFGKGIEAAGAWKREETGGMGRKADRVNG